MRRSLILVVSAGLNAALATALILSRHRGTQSPATETDSPPEVYTNAAKPRIIVRKQFFSWQEIETPDFRAYIANLRNIGCPEATVRNIIIAEVSQLYAKRRLAEVLTPDQQWWRSEPDPNVVLAANAKNRELDQERRALLTTLLGPGWELADVSASSRSGIMLGGPVFSNLTAEARLAVQQISARSQQRTADYLAAQSANGKNPDPAEMAKLRQQTRDELAQVLSPAQVEEFLLRYSQTATDLRRDLHGLEITPDEFRAIFRVNDPLDQQIEASYSGSDPASVAQRRALEQQREQAIKDILGPDLYQDYHLLQDPAYRDALALAQQAGAPPESVDGLYELSQATQREEARIRNDTSLTPEQKAAQLKALQEQGQAAREQLLGLTQPEPAPPPLPPLPPGFPAPVQTHAYSPGETLDQIAAQHNVTANAIIQANPNLDFNRLARGTPINIPQ